MSSPGLREALNVLNTALHSEDASEKAEAVAGLADMFYAIWFQSPKLGTNVLDLALRTTSISERSRSRLERLTTLLADTNDTWKVVGVARLLLMLNRPSWIAGGERHFSDAAPLDVVADRLLEFTKNGPIDFQTIGAIVLGNYGPEAEPYLGRVLALLEEGIGDCSMAPGLTYAAYMIGGLRPDVRALFEKILTTPRACPHSKQIARKVFQMNQLELPSAAN